MNSNKSIVISAYIKQTNLKIFNDMIPYKTIVLTFFILAFAVISAAAQSTQENGQIPTEARVIGSVTVQDLHQVRFRTVLQGTDKHLKEDLTVAARDVDDMGENVNSAGVSSSNAFVGNEEFGVVKVTFPGGKLLTVEIDYPYGLDLDGGSTQCETDGDANSSMECLILDPTRSGGFTYASGINGFITTQDFSGGANASSSITSGDIVIPNISYTSGIFRRSGFNVPDGGEMYLVLGGRVYAKSAQVPGTYTGNISVTAKIPD